MEYKEIKYEISDQILTITLNRPDKLNAFTPSMGDELIDAFDRADEDDNVRVVIVTGAGRAFCAGADLSSGSKTWEHKDSEDTLETHKDKGGVVTLRMYDMKKPLIAAINGHAVGIGITLTLAMDIRLVADNAKMGFVFARRGVLIESCSGWFLPRIVGISQAAEWALTGRVFSAQEALNGRLVSELLAPDALIPRAREIALEIAQNTSAISTVFTRQLLWKMLGADHPIEAHKIDSMYFYWAGPRADVAEGVQSFLEKRPPKFTMKPSTDLPEFYPWWTERPWR